MRRQRTRRESPWCPGHVSHLGCSPLQNGDNLHSPTGPLGCQGSKAAGGQWEGMSHRFQAGFPARAALPAFPRPPALGPCLSGLSFPSVERGATALLATSCSLCGPPVTGLCHCPRLWRLTRWASKASRVRVSTAGHPCPGPAQATACTVPVSPPGQSPSQAPVPSQESSPGREGPTGGCPPTPTTGGRALGPD